VHILALDGVFDLGLTAVLDALDTAPPRWTPGSLPSSTACELTPRSFVREQLRPSVHLTPLQVPSIEQTSKSCKGTTWNDHQPSITAGTRQGGLP
jgi:hypothetical protein